MDPFWWTRAPGDANRGPGGVPWHAAGVAFAGSTGSSALGRLSRTVSTGFTGAGPCASLDPSGREHPI